MRTLRKLLYIFFLLALPLSAFGRKESYGNGMLLTGTEKNAGVSDAEPQFQVVDVAIHSEEVAIVPIILHYINDLDVRGFQAKIILPEGLEYVKDTSGYAVLGDEYSSGYQITSNAVGTTLSILGFGTKSDKAFKEGILCYFKVKAAPDFKGGKINVAEAFITFDNQEIVCSTQSGEVLLSIPATSISLNLNQANLKVGETIQLEATVLPTTTTDKSIIWSSSDESIASVDANGLVTANKEGTAEIIAKAGSKEASVSITVIPTLAEAITLNRTTAALKISGTIQLTASFSPETTTDKTVTWISSNEAIATVDSEGLVTAQALGECEIIATTADGSDKSATCHITIGATPAESISIEPKGPFTLRVGETIQFNATVLPQDAADKSVSWMSQTGGVSIDANGLATAVAPVENNWISATNSAGQEAFVYITVVPNLVSSIEAVPQKVSLKVNQTIKVQTIVNPDDATDKSLKWESADSNIASVDIDGNITAHAIGQTTVIVSSKDGSGVSATISVSVIPTPAESIIINTPERTSFKFGETIQLTATVKPDDTTDKTIIWTSLNTDIVTIDSNGLVTARGAGSATITATNSAGQSAEITLTVLPTIAESLVLTNTEVNMQVGETFQLTALFTPATTTEKTLRWESTNPSIVSVDNNGLLTAHALGEVTVTATTTDGSNLTASCPIKVNPATVEQISIVYDGPTTIKVGDVIQLGVNIKPDNATDKSVTWLVQAAEVLNVTQDGKLTAVGPGKAWVGVETAGGSSAYLTFTVEPVKVERIEIEPVGATLKVGETVQLTAIITPENASNQHITWDSNDTGIASVDANGLVTGIGIGATDINARATDGSGVIQAVRINVISTSVEPVKVERIEIEPGGATLKVGETMQLTAIITPENASNQHITWDSNDTSIASVDANGLVTGIGIGATDINARATDGSGVIQAVRVNVISIPSIPVESITISANGSTVLKDGETLQLTATVLPENATDKSVRWLSNADSSATVDENGLVTAHSDLGVLDIYAFAGNVSDKIMLTIIETLAEDISLSSEVSEIRDKETISIYAHINPGTTTNKSITWNVSDESILKIQECDNSGCVLIGQKPGKAYVTATTVNGITQSYFVTVKPVSVQSITVPSEITVERGTQYEFKPGITPDNASDKQLVWESSNPNLGSFNGNVFNAHARGEVIATCRAVDGSDVFAQCHIKIETYAKSLTLNEHDLNLEKAGTFQLVATIEPIDAVDSGPIVWESSNEQCVSVDDYGLISAVSEGEATITARTQYYPWATDECNVKVSKDSGIENISIDEVAIHIEDCNITIEGLTKNSIVRLIDMNGKVLNLQRYVDQALNIKAPSTGVYILSVGKYSFKIIIR